jgi:NAD(P)H-dependent FMN reductase
MSSPSVCVIGASLSPTSRSQILARSVARKLGERGVNCTYIDLREPGQKDQLTSAALAVTHLVFAVPIYNFNVNGAAKEVIETLPGTALEGKTVGFLCAAGGQRSFMSVLSLANSLMLDFRCWIVPRFVYATGSDFSEDNPNAEISARIDQFVEDLLSK